LTRRHSVTSLSPPSPLVRQYPPKKIKNDDVDTAELSNEIRDVSCLFKFLDLNQYHRIRLFNESLNYLYLNEDIFKRHPISDNEWVEYLHALDFHIAIIGQFKRNILLLRKDFGVLIDIYLGSEDIESIASEICYNFYEDAIIPISEEEIDFEYAGLHADISIIMLESGIYRNYLSISNRNLRTLRVRILTCIQTLRKLIFFRLTGIYIQILCPGRMVPRSLVDMMPILSSTGFQLLLARQV
jgi:hypothetical protein